MEVSYFLRHYLASLKYRCSNAITHVSDSYPTFEIGEGVRKPVEILFHISQVLRSAQSKFDSHIKLNIEMKSWQEEVAQFYKEIEILDNYISVGLVDKDVLEIIIQGPLSDAMTHVGQLSMIRRLAGDPVPKQNYMKAAIKVE